MVVAVDNVNENNMKMDYVIFTEKKLLVCKNNNCENGIKGLGACKCGSKNGLWLGTGDPNYLD